MRKEKQMTFPITAREVTVFRGKGRHAVPIGKVVVDVGNPDCFKWDVLHANKLSALVTGGAMGANNPTGGI
jgi:hypothetical protein